MGQTQASRRNAVMTKNEPVIDVAINRMWPGVKLGAAPAEKRWSKYNGGFRAETHTPASLLAEITKGYSFSAALGDCRGLCCGNWCTDLEHKRIPGHCGRPIGYRRNAHFQSAQLVALDFDTEDERSSIDYLSRHPLVVDHASFLYTTLSHTPEHPKARVVFILETVVTDVELYRRLKRAVMARLLWGDASVHDPARMFYGSSPRDGQTLFLGNYLLMAKLDDLMNQHRVEMEAEQPRRQLPKIPAGLVLGATPAERYVNTAKQQETTWVASRVEGTGDRHKGLLIASMKLSSLGLSEWLPADVRAGIDPIALLMPAAIANGYVDKYGEVAALNTISDGMAYASPRPNPGYTRPRLRFSGGQWVKVVRA